MSFHKGSGRDDPHKSPVKRLPVKPYLSGRKKVNAALPDPTFLGVQWRFLDGSKPNKSQRKHKLHKIHKPTSLTHDGLAYAAKNANEEGGAVSNMLLKQQNQLPMESGKDDVSFVSLLTKNYNNRDKIGMNDPVIRGLLSGSKAASRIGSAGFNTGRTMSHQASRDQLRGGFTLQEAIDDADAEVRRITQAFEKITNEIPEVEEERRSPSPVIIWRPSARVKLATDIGPDLRAALMRSTEKLPEINTKHSSVSFEPHATVMGESNRIKKNTRRHPAHHRRPKHKAFVPIEKPKLRRPQYGAWYLPTDKWKLRYPQEYEGSEDESENEFQQQKDASHIRADGELVRRQQKCDGDIPGLYISRAYKSFIRSNDETGKIPHYLNNVTEFDDEVSD